jgi:hypothetical protein
VRQPPASELARQYAELLAENIGQPGFRELIVAVHDLDARRDLVFAVVGEARRREVFHRATGDGRESRRGELIDLSGVSRGHLADAVEASLAVPLATAARPIQFASDSYWRGEMHRLCDRPGAVIRLIDELTGMGVEQIVLVSAASEALAPHELARPRLDGRGRIGEYVQAAEAAAVRDALRAARATGARVFPIRPDYNPVGPFDFEGGFDDRSDRRRPLTELMARGYEDAYRQFVEPVIAPSGDRVGQAPAR